MNGSAQNFSFQLNTVTLRSIAKWLFVLLGIGLLFAAFAVLRSVVTIVIIALLLAFLLDPVVNFIENRGVSRLLSAILVFALIIFLGVLGFKFLAPVVSQEVQQLSAGADTSSGVNLMEKLKNKLGDSIPLLSNPAVWEEVEQGVNSLMHKSFSLVVDLLSAIVSIVMLAFITFFFIKDGRRMQKAVVSWVPNRYFEMTLIILHKISMQLGRYLRGQLLVSTIVGSLAILALYLLGVRYAFFIGAMAGLANMIPYFGPIVGAVPAIVVAFIDTGSMGAVAAVVVAFASIQLFENVFISPFVVAKSVALHPLTIIIAIMIGGQVLGIFGMLLAVPTASIIKVTVQELSWGLKNYRIFS